MLESNKFLALLLIGTMIFSAIGTIVSLNRISNISVTGYASEAQGDILLAIIGTVSITTIDGSEINFGTCAPSITSSTLINSEGTEGTGNCTGSFPQYIYVRNDGTLNVNVTILPDDVGEADGGGFLPSDEGTSRLEFRAINRGGLTGGTSFPQNYGGCFSGLQENYTVLDSTVNRVLVCANLTADDTQRNNSIATYFQLTLPMTAHTGYNSVTLTFQATEI